MSTEKAAPPKPIAPLDVAWREWSEVPRIGALPSPEPSRDGRGLSRRRAIEELGPGRQSSPAHFHIFEEEHVYILEGALTVRMGADAHDMKAPP